MLLTKMSMTIAMITPFMKHPMSMGFILINQTILISTIMFSESKLSWYSYILFITMIGGMMVMFMYMSSIASNEKFKMMPSKLIMLMFMMMIMYMMIKDQIMEINCTMEMQKQMMMKKEEIKSTSKFFNLNKMNITMMMMMTMLLTMISVTTISNSFEGPLKKK